MEEARNVLKQANRSKSVDLTVARDESEETVSYTIMGTPPSPSVVSHFSPLQSQHLYVGCAAENDEELHQWYHISKRKLDAERESGPGMSSADGGKRWREGEKKFYPCVICCAAQLHCITLESYPSVSLTHSLPFSCRA